MNRVFLFPGQLVVAEDPAVLATLLGSCVGVALYDRRTRRTGLNHFLLPESVPGDKPSTRYGDVAMRTLLNEFLRRGSDKRDLAAKVYGGASILTNVEIGQRIGEGNIEVAIRFLGDSNIPILERITGGNAGCRISVSSSDFTVFHEFPSQETGPEAATGVKPRKKRSS